MSPNLLLDWINKNNDINKRGVNNVLSIDLPKPPIISPQWLKNHRSNVMDIAIQDQDHVLYLYSNTGKLFWKKQIAGKIIGPIQQVDLYKNNRLQMAFRTQDKLIVLDRNGKIVKPFNIKLPKNEYPLPLSIFDYDNNRNYRFLVAQDKSLLMYDGRGKRVNGFKLKKVQAQIRRFFACRAPFRHASSCHVLRRLELDLYSLERLNGFDFA